MATKGIFFSYFKRAFLSKGYVLSIIGTMIVCYIGAKDYTEAGLSSVYTIDLMIHLGMFKKVAVFFAAVPFVTVFYDDYSTKYINSVVLRTGENKYIASTFINCVISSFSTIFLGTTGFFLILSCFYPPQPYDASGIYENLSQNLPLLFVLIIVGIFSLYASLWTAVGLTFSTIITNKYIALGSPLISGYIIEELTYNMPNYINLYKLSHSEEVFKNSVALNSIYISTVFVLIIALAGCLFSYVVKRRIRNEFV